MDDTHTRYEAADAALGDSLILRGVSRLPNASAHDLRADGGNRAVGHFLGRVFQTDRAVRVRICGLRDGNSVLGFC